MESVGENMNVVPGLVPGLLTNAKLQRSYPPVDGVDSQLPVIPRRPRGHAFQGVRANISSSLPLWVFGA